MSNKSQKQEELLEVALKQYKENKTSLKTYIQSMKEISLWLEGLKKL